MSKCVQCPTQLAGIDSLHFFYYSEAKENTTKMWHGFYKINNLLRRLLIAQDAQRILQQKKNFAAQVYELWSDLK